MYKTRVYKYGCKTPTSGIEYMEDQMQRMNTFWNRLVEIERYYQELYQQTVQAHLPDSEEQRKMEHLTGEIERLRQEIRVRRKQARKRVDISDLTELLDAAKNERSALFGTLRKQWLEARKAAKESTQWIERERKAAVKHARQEAAAEGLYWGNYNAVIDDYNVARVRAMKEGAKLRFRRYTGEGRIKVQISGGLDANKIFGGSQQIQVDKVPSEAWTHPKRGERRRMCRTLGRIRATSEGRDPVWVEFPMSMHRPLPPKGRIQEAEFVRRRVGNHYKYHLCITVREPIIATPPPSHKAIALDVGWRLVDGGLRVAYWVDEDGNHGELVLPHRVVGSFEKITDLQQIRDQNLNLERERLNKWLKDNANVLPEWLVEETATLAQWRSPARFASLALKWRELRFDGDGEGYDPFEAWRKQDKHLWEWQANQTVKVGRHRREIYRVFAAWLAENYGHIVLEDFDLRQVAQHKPAENDDDKAHKSRYYRTIAAIYELRSAIENAVHRDGGKVHYIEAEWTTQRCHVCKEIERFDAERQLWHTCSTCGALWDQDHNAAINLLDVARGTIEAEDAGALEPA